MGPRERIKHGGRCPAYNNIFWCLWMLLRHLCDERRTQCRDSLLASTVEPLSATAMAEFYELYKGECAKAKRAGHTQILSKAPAFRDGKLVRKFCSEDAVLYSCCMLHRPPACALMFILQ